MRRLSLAIAVMLLVSITSAQGRTALGAVASVAVDVSTIPADNNVTVSWDVAAPTGGDWIGLYPAAASDDTAYRLGWFYTGGGVSGVRGFGISPFIAPGDYQFRLFTNNSLIRIGTSGTFAVTANEVSVMVSPSTFPVDTIVTVSWSGHTFPDGGDWVGLYRAGSSDDTSNRYAWRYTGAAQSGSTPFSIAPNLPPGDYDFRFFYANTLTRLGKTGTITITASAASISVDPASFPVDTIVTVSWSGQTFPDGGDWIGLYRAGSSNDTSNRYAWRYKPATANGSVSFNIAPSIPPGDYEFRLFYANTLIELARTATIVIGPPAASITASITAFPADTTLTVSWSGQTFPDGGDWIGLYRAGSSNDTSNRYAWRYKPGTTSGTVSFDIGPSIPPGEYEFRLFYANSLLRLANSGTITIRAPETSVSAAPIALRADSYIGASWSGHTYPDGGDWLGFYVAGSTDDTGNRVTWRYSGGASSGGVSMLVPIWTRPGQYDVRMFWANSLLRLGRSGVVSVAAPDVRLTATPRTFAPGQTVRVSWSDHPQNDGGDWIGIYPLGSSDDTSNRVTWRYSGAAENGYIDFVVPGGVSSATHEFRMFWANSLLRIGASSLTQPPNTAPAVSLPANADATRDKELVVPGSFSDPDTDQSWTATVDYGDGTRADVALESDKSFLIRHAYTRAGFYSLTVTVTDSAGAAGIATTFAKVTEPTVDLAGSSLGLYSKAGILAKDPVNSFTGNLTLPATDVTLRARGRPLEFTRVYNSIDTRVGPLGRGWSSIFDAGLRPGETTAVVTRPDGRRDIFVRQSDGSYRPPSGVFDELVRDSAGAWTLTQRDRVRIDFSPGGGLVRITDRNGNTLSFERDSAGRAVRMLDRAGRALSFGYDGAGRLVSLSDPAGRRVSYAYTADRLTSVVDPTGAATRYAYNAAGQLLTITDALGNVVLRNVYDADGRVTAQTDAAGSRSTFAYDTTTRVTTITDARGGATRISHDTLGRPTRIEDPLGAATESTYDSRGNLVSSRDRNGNVTTFEYDDRGNRTRTTDAGGGIATFTYDTLNDLLTRTDANGNVWRNQYDLRGNLTVTIDPEGGALRIEVDGSGLPTRITDADGVVTEMAYDAAGNVVSTRTVAGATENRYDAAGRLVGSTDALGRVTRRDYDAANRVVRTTDPLGHATVFRYDAVGNLVATTDRRGATTTFTYDAAQRVVTVTDALNQTTRFTYDASGNRLSVTDATSRAIRYGYDARDRVVAVTDAEGGVTRLSYDANGNLVARTDARGAAARFTYDFRDQRTSLTDRVGGRTEYAYDGAGRLVLLTSPLGAKTRLAYDRANRPVATVDPLGNETRIAYTVAGRRASVRDPSGNTTRFGYDSTGRLITTTDALGGQWRLAYDAAGNMIGKTDPLGRITQFGYDPLDRMDSVIDALGKQRLLTYDPNGTLTAATDANGGTTSYVYDVIGRLSQVTDPLGGVTRYRYDARGMLVGLTDANGHARSSEYDGNRRLVTETDALGRGRSYTYDANGNVVQIRDAKSQTTSFTYDAEDRLTQINYADGTSVRYSRNAAGDRLQMLDSLGTTSYAYDAMRRLVSVTDPYNKTVRYAYEPNGLRSALTYPDGRAASYTYDALDRLVGVDYAGASSARYTYDAVGNATAAVFGNGTRFDATFNALDQLTVLAHRDGRGKVISSLVYAYDALGNVIREGDGKEGDRTYGYDALARLTAVARGDEEVTRYRYDAVGNRVGVTRDDGEQVAVFDAADQLTSVRRPDGLAAETFIYDANGNLTDHAKPDGATRFQYDTADRLVGVRASHDSVAFAYDGDSNLMREQRSESRATLTYTLDVARSMAQVLTASDGRAAASYLYGLGRIGSVGSQTRYYVADVRGSVRSTTDERGKHRGRQGYDAWAALDHEGDEEEASLGKLFGFTGERQDPATGLLYLRARWYDPSLGRFLQRDTFAGVRTDPRTLNRFAYAQDNPASRVDPSGFSSSSLFQPVGDSCSGKAGLVPNVAGQVADKFADLLGVPRSQTPADAGLMLVLQCQYSTQLAPSTDSQAQCTPSPFTVALPGLIVLGPQQPCVVSGRVGGPDPLYAKAAAGAPASPGSDAPGSEGGGPFVYRGLAEGEDPALGLIARNPDAGNDVVSHIAGKRDTQWISTTKSLEIAQTRFGKYGVVRIDLSKVGSEIVDASNGIPGLAKENMLSRWASAAKEVLIRGYIPPDAIKIIGAGP